MNLQHDTVEGDALAEHAESQQGLLQESTAGILMYLAELDRVLVFVAAGGHGQRSAVALAHLYIYISGVYLRINTRDYFRNSQQRSFQK